MVTIVPRLRLYLIFSGELQVCHTLRLCYMYMYMNIMYILGTCKCIYAHTDTHTVTPKKHWLRWQGNRHFSSLSALGLRRGGTCNEGTREGEKESGKSEKSREEGEGQGSLSG